MKKLAILLLLLPVFMMAEVVFTEDFESMSEGNFGDWITVSVTGDQVWTFDGTHGYNGSKCLKMSGYVSAEQTTYANEDWLISPAVDLSGNNEAYVKFMTAANYTGNDIEVFITDNYTGDVTSTSWTALTPAISGGGWAWIDSGSLDISSSISANTRIAFKYTCDATGSKTWEIDEVEFSTEAGETPPPVETIWSEDFEGMSEGDFGNWLTVSVAGDQTWTFDGTHGYNGSKCLKMSGYVSAEQTTYANEDWLISPAVDLSAHNEAYLNFMTAANYTGNDIEVFVTDNYTGDVATTNWTAVNGELSGGSWSWVESGNIDVSAVASATTRVAFKYTCDDTGSKTWEIDEVKFVEDGGVTPPPTETLWNEDFEAMSEGNFGEWQAISVIGDQTWTFDGTHGYNGSKCLKMSGYVSAEQTTYANEDWLVSPAIDLTGNENVFLSFMTAANYTGNDIEVFITGDFTGDVATTTWTALNPELSGGSWSWVTSGDLDVTNVVTANTRVAFKYTCDDQGSKTWEIDEVKFTGEGTTPVEPEAVWEDNFDTYEGNLGNWNAVSVAGDQVWNLDETHGYNGSKCAKMSGYVSAEQTTYANEDWLISPAIDLSNVATPKLTFKTASNFTGNDIEVYVASSFTGDVTTTNWTALNPTLSSGGWSWVDSGELDIEAVASATTYIAFKYTCDDQSSKTWEIDEVKVIGSTTSSTDAVAKFNPSLTNYPNPFNPTTEVAFTTKVNGNAKVEIFNIKGQKVATLHNGNLHAGSHKLTWHGKNANGTTAATGVYFVKLQAKEGTAFKKMLMLK